MENDLDGEFIDTIHSRWRGNYALLEDHHAYIQWLFPVFENGGVNPKAHALSRSEARLMRRDQAVSRRVVLSCARPPPVARE